jgi:hypothetical protein
VIPVPAIGPNHGTDRAQGILSRTAHGLRGGSTDLAGTGVPASCG